MDEPADQELVNLARQGDTEAFGRLIERYQSLAGASRSAWLALRT